MSRASRCEVGDRAEVASLAAAAMENDALRCGRNPQFETSQSQTDQSVSMDVAGKSRSSCKSTRSTYLHCTFSLGHIKTIVKSHFKS